MARKPPAQAKSAALSVEGMRAALPKLDRRIRELENFEISSISKRFDPVMDVLADKVNGTLQEIFGHDSAEYQQYSVGTFDTLPLRVMGGSDPLPRVHEGYRDGVQSCVLKLRTLKEIFEERIADAEAQPASPQGERPRPSPAVSIRKVFVVHGHDDGAKETVARYLSTLGLEPVILHEQPNQGRTVVEKFEAHSQVSFAVVLFTPDDIGHAAGKPEEQKPRARQNVVLELGFFMGTLGRDKVCVLYRSGVEIPSDYSGVLYHAFDDAGSWRFHLAREMKAAGIDVDLNKAF